MRLHYDGIGVGWQAVFDFKFQSGATALTALGDDPNFATTLNSNLVRLHSSVFSGVVEVVGSLNSNLVRLHCK